MADKTVSKVIELKDQYSSTLADLQKGLTKSISELNKMDNSLQGAEDSLEKVAKKQKGVESAFKSASVSMTKLSKSTEDANKKNKEYVEGLDDITKNIKGNDSILSKFGESLSEAFKDDGIKGVAGAVGGLITQFAIAKEAIEAIKGGVEFTIREESDRQKASNKIQASTGLSKVDAEKYNKSISDVYTSGYGEDRTEIAGTIGLINQQMGKLDTDKMTEFAKNIYAIENAFGTDANESIRGINAMMKQFEISQDKATNLFVQGAQSGLNQNQDLFDQMSEYSVYWKELGFSAEDAMNMLKSGIDTGAFQVDKINDAIKELRIRGKDGTADNYFKMLGLDADKTKANLNSGGAAAKNQTLDILNRLSRVVDKGQQFTIGQGIMGTQWEDVGAQSILALTNFKDSINGTKNAVDSLKTNQFADLESRFDKIGRELKEAVSPLEEIVTPSLNKFADWLENSFVPAVNKFSNWITSDSTSANIAKAGVETGLESTPVVGPAISMFNFASSLFGDKKVDGNQNGRKSGLNRVPYDNYYTYLHKGERVLTRREADDYQQNNGIGGGSIMIAKLADQITVREEVDIDKIATKLVQNIQNARLVSP